MTHLLRLSPLLLAVACISSPGVDTKNGIDSGLDTEVDSDDTDDTTVDTDEDTDDTDPPAPCYEDDDGTENPQFDLCEYEDDPINGWFVDCSSDPSTMQLVFRTNDWGYNGVAYIADTRFSADYDEEHDLTETSNSADSEGWSIFELDLETDWDGLPTTPYTPNVNTVFTCAAGGIDPAADDFQATIALAIYEADTTTIADCIVFGQDPDELISRNIVQGNGMPGSITPPAWVNDTNCRNVNAPAN